MRVFRSPWGIIAQMFPAYAAIVVRMGPKAHPKLLELIFEFLRKIFDVVGRPILDVHAKVQTHA